MNRSPLTTLGHDLRELTSETGDAIAGTVENAASEASRALTQASKALTRAADRLVEELTTSARNTTRAAVSDVRRHPLATTALMVAALGFAGFVLLRTTR